jgi:hypothetical protein
MSSLKINFGKSEIIMVSLDEQKTLLFSELINCASGSWPIKYLGVPVSGSRLHVKGWMSLNDKILKRLDGWQSTSLSYGGKLILLNACLSCIPTYAMSMYLLPKTVVKKIDIVRKRFFWQGGANKRKYHLVKWAVITKSKKKGGLGVKNLRKMNISLLCKWWWKLENEEGLWQDIVRKKYKVRGGIVNLRNKPSNSPVWNDLIKIKGVYLAGRIMKIGDGRDIDFWRDPWYGRVNLIEKFRDLYDISNEQYVSVADMAQRGWRLTFRRWLDENAQNQLRFLRDILMSCALGQQKDRPIWVWEKHKQFSVKSMYAHLCEGELGESNRRIWKAKIPLKN